MTLQGLGLSGENIDLDVGTAIFARHAEKDIWNDAYIQELETKYWNQSLFQAHLKASGILRRYRTM